MCPLQFVRRIDLFPFDVDRMEMECLAHAVLLLELDVLLVEGVHSVNHDLRQNIRVRIGLDIFLRYIKCPCC